MPYCRKCNPGEYQPLSDQIACESCPPGFISPRGSNSSTQCYMSNTNVCLNRMSCGLYGQCIELQNGLYNCKCEPGYFGE